MATLLRIDSSFRTEGSISRALADTAQASWLATHPRGTLVARDLGVHPLPSTAWSLSVSAGWAPEDAWTPEQRASKALAAELADELLEADTLLLAAPLYNFGVPASVKAWIDLLISDPRLGPGSTALAGKSALLVIARGGGYGEGTPRHGWDHSTGYLQRIFADNFGMTVETVAAELTLAPVVPAMAGLIGLHEQSLASAHVEARTLGGALAARLHDAA